MVAYALATSMCAIRIHFPSSSTNKLQATTSVNEHASQLAAYELRQRAYLFRIHAITRRVPRVSLSACGSFNMTGAVRALGCKSSAAEGKKREQGDDAGEMHFGFCMGEV